MMPGMDNQQMMRMQQVYGMQMNGDLRKNAMNNRGAYNQPYVLTLLVLCLTVFLMLKCNSN